jgi:SRSO17 transposase
MLAFVQPNRQGFGMTPKQFAGVQGRLDEFLEDLVEPIGRSERRHWAGVYVQGLLLDGARKSVQPMAARIEGADEQALNQFLNQSPWAVAEIQRRLARRLSEEGHEPVYWMIDETSFPKAGEHSVGAARQYCGTLGKIANCQVAVSLHWRQERMSYPVSWRLYLPKDWCKNPGRRTAARIPQEVVYQTKTDLALELVEQAMQWDVPRGAVLADSFYGNNCSFRAALRDKRLDYAVAVEPTTVVWTEDPNKVPVTVTAKTGRPRQYPRPQDLPAAISLERLARQLPKKAWRKVTWRIGTKGPQRSRFALTGVWAAHKWQAQAHPLRVREWLLIEWPEDAPAPSDYWMLWRADRDEAPALLRAVRTARGRWPIEQDYRELKEELGLDHFEGRGWPGWHHHVTLVTLAFAFLRSEQLRFKKNFTCELADDPAPPAGGPDPDGGPMSVVPDEVR